MDQRERIGDRAEYVRAAIDDALANSWHCMPAIVQSFNAAAMTCVVQIALKIPVRDSKGNVTQQTIRPLVDVPAQFPGGGNFLVTFPLVQGDEVLVIFADRCIDAWRQSGGTQMPAEFRIHDISDGFAIPKIWSTPNVPTNISATTAQIRTKDGNAYIELAAGGVINIVAPGGLNLNGAMIATGEITAKSTHTVSAHTHSDPQGGSTGAPTG